MRISRSCYNSKFFHVMVQGIKKERIFQEKKMKQIFIKYLKESVLNNSVDLLAYCVMNNHAHILVYTDDTNNLTKMMHSLNTRYAQLYNRSFERCGYVFRDRYRCENIMTVDHLKNCIRYIHNNPVKANICAKCSDYSYSSYNEYMNQKIDTRKLKETLGEDLKFIKQSNMAEEPTGVFLDVDNEFAESSKITIEEVVENYCVQKNISREKMDKAHLGELVRLLINKYRIKKIDIQKEINVSKYMIYEVLRNEENAREN